MREVLVKAEEFKDSPVGRIPKDWEVFKLSEVVPRAEYGISVSLDDEVGIPVLRMNNLKNGEVELTDLKKSASSKAANLLLQPLDVLFNRTNSIEHVGRTGIWRGQIEQASFASYLVRLIPDKSKLISEYLNLWLNLPSTQVLIRRYATPGVHQVNINPTNLRKVLIVLPQNVSEQQRIAEILDTVDDAIARTSSLITKLKQTKAGLLHDLLTRGLDEDGHLRDAGAHPEEFKDSALGRIPKDWQFVAVADIAKDVTDGDHHTPKRSDSGVFLLSARNVLNGSLALEDVDFVPEHEYQRMIRRCYPEPGDILISCSGTIGRVCEVPAGFRCVLVRSAALVKLDRTRCQPRFIEAVLQSDTLQTQILMEQLQAAQPNLFQGSIKRLSFPLPPLNEQERISVIIDSHNTRIRKEEAYLNKLKLQKQGLMHDLLTGKVRVNDMK